LGREGEVKRRVIKGRGGEEPEGFERRVVKGRGR
jgi:hypothetical protein